MSRTPDLPAEDAAIALRALASASRVLLDSLDDLTHEGAHTPSQLPSWKRSNIITHLAYLGRALVRMTDDALDGKPVITYPGGPDERAESIKRGNHLPADMLRKELGVAIEELERMWSQLDEADWDRTFHLDRIGETRLTHLLMLRWTEIEVHLSDMGFNDDAFNVTDLFVAAALPLRVSWLVQHHRSREDADRSVRGIWNLRASTSKLAWTVGTPNASQECIIEGTDHDLLGFILGRVPVSHLSLDGNIGLAYRFKLAFPGP